jgi:hypothetical protein
MSDEQINIAIAEACGWKEIQSSHAPVEFGRRPHGWKRTEHGNRTLETQIPDYCNDLNAMHEAGETLDNDFYFAVNLYHLIIPQGDQYDDHTITWSIANKLIRATARQRAEAFLKTLGKWEDIK